MEICILTSDQKPLKPHLHANAAHHLMCGRKITVSGESGSMAGHHFDVKQLFDVSCIQLSNRVGYWSVWDIYHLKKATLIMS